MSLFSFKLIMFNVDDTIQLIKQHYLVINQMLFRSSSAFHATRIAHQCFTLQLCFWESVDLSARLSPPLWAERNVAGRRFSEYESQAFNAAASRHAWVNIAAIE